MLKGSTILVPNSSENPLFCGTAGSSKLSRKDGEAEARATGQLTSKGGTWLFVLDGVVCGMTIKSVVSTFRATVCVVALFLGSFSV